MRNGVFRLNFPPDSKHIQGQGCLQATQRTPPPPMAELLARWETIKKDNHGKHCHKQRKRFSPFFSSVDGMLGREALAILSQLSQVMLEKRGGTPFASTGVGKRTNRNRRCEFLLTNDPRSSDTQSPAVKGVGLGFRIGNGVFRLNCPPDSKHIQGQGCLQATQRTPPPPTAHHARYHT